MNTLWSDHLDRLTPYVPGEQVAIPGLLKLNTNENPYGPSPRVREALVALADDRLRLYPDPEAHALTDALAHHFSLTPDQVFVGNGSDEVLAHVFNAFFRRGDRALWMPDITYSFYTTYGQLFDVPCREIPLADDFSLRVADYTAAADPEPCGVLFANPNAPTGRALSRDQVAEIARARPDSVVVVDEAYVDFGAESAVALVAHHPNLVVIQTFSKSRALAGLRVGFAVAQPPLIEALRRVKDSFNSYPLGTLAQAGAVAALQDVAWFEHTCRAIMDARTGLVRDLVALGFEVLPSHANFLFVRHGAQTGETLAARLREQAILVRHFRSPRVADFLRITVGTPAQCARLRDAFERILAG